MPGWFWAVVAVVLWVTLAWLGVDFGAIPSNGP